MLRFWLVTGLTTIIALAACIDEKSKASYKPGDGGGGAGGVGLGIGEICQDDSQCRPGLVCPSDQLTCQPGGTLAEGDACLLNAECGDDLYCESGLCAPAGSGSEGDPCVGNGDCQKGFQCTLAGFGATCSEIGDETGLGDIGAECGDSAECYSPLVCGPDGTCSAPTPGFPFGIPWPGVDCPEPVEGDPTEAYFRVPRGTPDDGDFFRLPFPNDVRLDAGTIDLSGFPTPGDELLGFDIVQRYADAVVDTRDGWGMYQGIIFRYSHALDGDSFPDDVFLVNLTTGAPQGLFWYYSSGRSNYVCNNRMVISRPNGRIMEPGNTYVAYVTTGFTDTNGAPVQRPDDLIALLSTTPPTDPALAPHWDKYESFRLYLSDNMIDPDTVLNASVVTIGTPRSPVEQMQGIIDAAGPPSATGWTLCDTGVSSPCPDAAGDRACGSADADYYELHALVSMPIFQQGTGPYLADGGNIKLTAGVPTVDHSENVCLSLTIPKDVMPVGGWPTLVFAHGTGGHFRSHIVSGIARDVAQGISDGQGNTLKVATLAIDQVMHGPRRNGSDMSPNDLYFNFVNPKAALGNPQQGAADQMTLLRFVPTVSFDATGPTGEIFNLSNNIAYWGHSQGAAAGALAVPFGDWAGAIFTGQGGSLKDSLITKNSPVDIAGVVPFVLQDFNSEGKLPYGRTHPVLNLMQHYIDGGDPVNYGNLAVLTPPGSEEAKHVFQVYGLFDSYTPGQTQENYAIAAGLGLAEHDASVGMPDDIASKTTEMIPATNNHTINGKDVSAYLREYEPAAGDDGHFVAFDVSSADADVKRFLAGILSGVVPQVGQ